MARHHDLPVTRLFGKALRHVAVHGETWLALVGWQAGAEQVAHWVRGHWEIENRRHDPSDCSFDEDCCRVRVGNLPRNLATLSNLAVSLIRLGGRFDNIPTA